jgi:DNA polymerase I
MEVIYELPPALGDNDFVAIDLELFQAKKKHLHRPTTGTFACLAFCNDPEVVYIVTDENDVAEALDRVKKATWVFHNAMFDITHLRRWATIKPRKKLWDVMIIDHILGGGLYDVYSFSLEDISRRRLDILMDKSTRKTLETATELTTEQAEYCARDAQATLLICFHQQKNMTGSDFRIWTDVDRKAFWPMLDFIGFRIDAEAWKALAVKNKQVSQDIAASLDFNPASPQQVKEVLQANGFKMLRNTEEDTLLKEIQKHPKAKACEIAKTVLEFRKYAKRSSTYGMKFLTDYVEDDGNDVLTIRACYWVCGAETGRTSSDHPNFQNIPIKDTKDFRQCFIARPGNKLVIVDMGQQEARNAAYVSQDAGLINILKDKSQDIFVGMARKIYKRDISKSDPFRKQVKNTVYGLFYGISAEGMAERYDMTKEEAQRAIDGFFREFPDVLSWIRIQQRKTTYVETVYGRKVYLNPYSGQAERNAVNDVIQGTAADQMKIALGNIFEKWQKETGLDKFMCVGYIHDELIFDVPEDKAELVAAFVAREMINAAEFVCPGIPFTADPIIADTWAEKE